MKNILQCPVCRKPLLQTPGRYRCPLDHAFDVAREGYVNLLLAHKKKSRDPGDGRDMIASRRRFLDRGFYNRISDGINQAAAGALRGQSTAAILDAGCGEGFYLQRLKEFLRTRPGEQGTADRLEFYGADISKSAVRAATRRDRSIGWIVANVFDLPFADGSLDMVLNVFSPADFRQLGRVLRDQGMLVVAGPGPKHLNGLREVLYPEAREHPPSTISREADEFFSLTHEERIHYPLELGSSDAIMELLSMTPYFWNIDLATKATVEALDRLSLDVDVLISVFTRRPTRPVR